MVIYSNNRYTIETEENDRGSIDVFITDIAHSVTYRLSVNHLGLPSHRKTEHQLLIKEKHNVG